MQTLILYVMKEQLGDQWSSVNANLRSWIYTNLLVSLLWSWTTYIELAVK